MLLRLAGLIERHATVLGELTRLTLDSMAAFNGFEARFAANSLRYYVSWI